MSTPARDEWGFVDEDDKSMNFKGWRRYFNTHTMRGRANVSPDRMKRFTE